LYFEEEWGKEKKEGNTTTIPKANYSGNDKYLK